MIKNSFIFLDRVGLKTEQNLWKQGISTWDDFLEKGDIKGISKRTKYYYDREIQQARTALYEDRSQYFAAMPSTETWRLYDFFREDAVFLDVEASGSTMDSYVTVIGLYDGRKTMVMVKHLNLDICALKKELSRYKLIITYNGSSFDLPFLEKKYPGLVPNVPHIDTRHLCAGIGLSGGLKEIEEELGIQRDNVVERIYGGDPLKLWRMFLGSGDRYYLNLLVEYNEEDIINLKTVTEHAITRKKEILKDAFPSVCS